MTLMLSEEDQERYSAYEDPPLKSAVLDLATDLPLF